MPSLEDRFVEILVDSGALLKGRFQLKSGNTSDFFVDFGRVPDGLHLERLGECYVEKILDTVDPDGFDVVFGPAYKAIPIVTAVAIALQSKFSINRRYAFNRKVPKDHGEGGQLLGGFIDKGDRVLVVDDVFTDGGAKLDALRLLKEGVDAEVIHVLVGVDRSEPGALEKFGLESGGVPVTSICDMRHVRAAFDMTGRTIARRRR